MSDIGSPVFPGEPEEYLVHTGYGEQRAYPAPAANNRQETALPQL